MIDKRAPYPGDVLLDPPRMVTWVNVDRREFRCTSLVALPPEYAPAPIEDGWRDLTNLTVPEDYARVVETFDATCCTGCGCKDGEVHREGCPSEAALTVWVIYYGAKNHPPGKWVLRAQDVRRDGTITPRKAYRECDSLDEARSGLPPGLTRVDFPEEDTVIVETWV